MQNSSEAREVLSVVVNFVFKYAKLKLPLFIQKNEVGKEPQYKDGFGAHGRLKADGGGRGALLCCLCGTREEPCGRHGAPLRHQFLDHVLVPGWRSESRHRWHEASSLCLSTTWSWIFIVMISYIY